MMLEINDQFIWGDGHVIEIDESLLSKSKYNIRWLLIKKWVVGRIDLDDGETFFSEKLFWGNENLNTIVLDHDAKGTIITTDK